MTRKMNGFIAQSGVIPFRFRRGRLEVALVTSSSGSRWTIPKGHIEPELSPQDSAAKEAYEEAGLIGQVQHRSIGAYRYVKREAVREVDVYLMAVTDTLREWPEQHRRRRWLTVEEASWKVTNDDLRKCLMRAGRLIRQPARALAA